MVIRCSPTIKHKNLINQDLWTNLNHFFQSQPQLQRNCNLNSAALYSRCVLSAEEELSLIVAHIDQEGGRGAIVPTFQLQAPPILRQYGARISGLTHSRGHTQTFITRGGLLVLRIQLHSIWIRILKCASIWIWILYIINFLKYENIF